MGNPSKTIRVPPVPTLTYTARSLAPAALVAGLVLGCGSNGGGPGFMTSGGNNNNNNNNSMSGTAGGGSGAAGSGVSGAGASGTTVVGGTGAAGSGGASGITMPGSGTVVASGVTGGGSGTGLGSGSGMTVVDSGLPTNPPMCVPSAGGAALPANFFVFCSGCHSAWGVPGNPAVPNLFTYSGGATLPDFSAHVRAPAAGSIMPGYTTAALPDADLSAMFNYFKGGTPAPVGVCPGANGIQNANLGACSGKAQSFAPLFVPTQSQFAPISYVDPATKHIIFRGAGRVRFRHEMEVTYEIFHDHYFEDRTFGYILDDSIAAGGTTIDTTFLPDSNQYYSKQTLAGGQQGGADLNIRFWKIYGGVDGNVFAGNAGGAWNNVLPVGCAADPNAPSCNTQKYLFTVNYNQRENRPIKVGDQFQIEYGMFIARYGSGSAAGVSAPGNLGPPFDTTHVRNILPLPAGCTLNGGPYTNGCYTQANYYSDSFRYVVGTGSLTPANQDCTMTVPPSIQGTGADFPHPYDCSPAGPIAQAVAAGKLPDRLGPIENGWSGGIVTMPYIRQRHDLYYSQMSPNILHENSPNFVQGRRLFHTDYTTGVHIEVNNDLSSAETAVHANMAGPLYNQVACEGCHSHNNRGVPPAAGAPFDSIVVKLMGTGLDAHGGPVPDPNYGKQLQNKALTGFTPEGSATFSYATVSGAFKDGTAYTLNKPTVMFTGLSSGNPAAYSVRLARPLIGMGLLEAIPEADILAHADPTDCNSDGVKGVPNIVFDPEDGTMKVGRFGWKASKASVKHQVAEALLLDIGVTTSVFPTLDCGPNQAACTGAAAGKKQMTDGDLMQLVTYQRTLAVPPRRDLANPNVVRGEALFATIGCVNCHSPNQHTGPEHPFLELQNQNIHPYTDLLLHDMGMDLADNSVGEYAATPSMWRTPPLWAIGLCDEVAAGYQQDVTLNPAPNQAPCHYLHDGRAATLLEAVLWHGGEALNAKNAVLALSAADRNALVAFLQSL